MRRLPPLAGLGNCGKQRALIPLRDLLPFAKMQTGEGDNYYSLRPFREAEWEKVPKGDEGSTQTAALPSSQYHRAPRDKHPISVRGFLVYATDHQSPNSQSQ